MITNLVDTRHPLYLSDFTDWEKWRLTYGGGAQFRDRYLEKFDKREDSIEFSRRKKLTPVPAYAKAAINDVRNSIFQRLIDVVRHSGSDDYQRAVQGQNGGVDRRGSTMNYFLGNEPLTDLLVMGRVGVFVDMPTVYGSTLAETTGKRPYCYFYRCEDILNWSQTCPDHPSEFSSVILRDSVLEYDQTFWLPIKTVQRYRHMWISPETGLVNVQFYDADGQPVDINGMPAGSVELQLTRIPFVLMSIGDSLLKDTADHQVALMNLGSSDINYCLQSNFPFYTEQKDTRAVGGHLKKTASDGTSMAGGQGASDEVIKVGVTQGRYYDLNAERPQFIAPPSEPIEASMKLQDKLEIDIRKLISLAVTNLGSRMSGEAKKQDNSGLEAGLSYIGLVLEAAERKIADYWSRYENKIDSRRQVAVIKYPDSYSLKTDTDRIEQASELSKLMFAVPGRTVKREIAKNITTVLLGGKINVETLQAIHQEIDSAKYTTSDPKVIIEAKNASLCGDQTASMALGFDDDEHLQAKEDHLDRIKRIAETQGVADSKNAGARGVDDLSPDPSAQAKAEKEASRNTDTEDTTKPRVRGEGKEDDGS